jgi:hypothetical protein
MNCHTISQTYNIVSSNNKYVCNLDPLNSDPSFIINMFYDPTNPMSLLISVKQPTTTPPPVTTTPVTTLPVTTPPVTSSSTPTDQTIYNIMPVFPSLKNGLILDYIPHNRINGYHRSGWEFVMNAIKSNFTSSNNKIIFDDYLDMTFFDSNNYSMLPYPHEWIGVIHHPPDTNYSPINAVNLINNPLFKKSLSNCKGIIAMSKYLQSWLIKNLPSNIPVYYIAHPTLFVNNLFNTNNYNLNQSKQIMQIGGWLRDSYGIYSLYVNNPSIQKMALKGLGMDAYFKPKDFDFTQMAMDEYYMSISGLEFSGHNISNHNISSITSGQNISSITSGHNISSITSGHNISSIISGISGHNISSIISGISGHNISSIISGLSGHNISSIISGLDGEYVPNKYVEGMINSLQHNDSSVLIQNKVDNQTFDNLLSSNIVFLKLVDASACNTLIECIVRNTPIIINKLDAITELLGKDYPLYYETIEEASLLATELTTNETLLTETINYLSNLDKSPLMIGTFMTDLFDIIKDL